MSRKKIVRALATDSRLALMQGNRESKAKIFPTFKVSICILLFAFCYYFYLKAHMMIFKRLALRCRLIDCSHQNCYNRIKLWLKTIQVSKYHKG